MRIPTKVNLGLFCCICICLSAYTASGVLSWALESAQRPIVTNVELVQVPVIVFNEKGAVATNLKKSDFRLLDDGVVQQILYLDRVRTPVSFVILGDLSSSMTKKIAFVQAAAISLLDPLNQQDSSPDEYSVLGIGTRTHRLADFTHDQQDLLRRIPLLLTAKNEATALFDGIYLGITMARKEADNQRCAMIIISDGGDNHSRYNIRETKTLLEEADIPVFAVMAGSDFPFFFSPTEKKQTRGEPWPKLTGFLMDSSDDYIGPAERAGPHNLKVLTEATGGGVFTARRLEDISRIARTIGRAVRYQYVLSYKPLHEEGAEVKRLKGMGKNIRHKIHIELYPNEDFKGYSVPYYKKYYTLP
jgi:Ca-activated chloride channel family protein